MEDPYLGTSVLAIPIQVLAQVIFPEPQLLHLKNKTASTCSCLRGIWSVDFTKQFPKDGFLEEMTYKCGLKGEWELTWLRRRGRCTKRGP